MRINKLVLLLAFIVCIIVSLKVDAKTTYPDITVDRVVSVYDGDTFTITQRHWAKIVGYKISIRVNGVDTPEISGKCRQEKLMAKQAKQFTINALNNGLYIKLRNIHRGKYFRIVADVYIDGVNLANTLINEGLGRRYNGGKRGGWCE